MVKLVLIILFAYPKNLVHPHGGWTKDKSCEKQAKKFISKKLEESLICKDEKGDRKRMLKWVIHFKGEEKFRKIFSTFLSSTNTFKNSNNSNNFNNLKQFKTIIVHSVKCAVRLVGYLLNVNGSVAGQYRGWFFEDILDTFPIGLYACLTIQRQIGRPLEDCSKREWRGYLVEIDL